MLTLSHDDGHVEAEMELHADKAGHLWKVRLYNEGVKDLPSRGGRTPRTVAERCPSADC